MGEVKICIYNFCSNFCIQFPVARTTQTTLLDLVKFDLSVQGILFFQQSTLPLPPRGALVKILIGMLMSFFWG